MINEKRKGNYDKLEDHHSYIQWIFPNSTRSRFNPDAEILSPKEAKIFMEDIEIANRLVCAYELMLDFYGMKLDRKTGKISRSENWNDRYILTLIEAPHNHLRITRIMHCLVETGFSRYSEKLSEFLLAEIAGNDEYKSVKTGIKTKETLNTYKPLDCLAKSPCRKFWAEFSTNQREVANSRTKLVARLNDVKDTIKKVEQKESIFFKVNGY